MTTSLQRIDRDGVAILKLNGSLDTEGLERVGAPFETILRTPGLRAVIDLTGVDLVTTPAISLFISASSNARQTGGRIVFTQGAPPVQDVLRRLRLNTVLRTVPGLEEAVTDAGQ